MAAAVGRLGAEVQEKKGSRNRGGGRAGTNQTRVILEPPNGAKRCNRLGKEQSKESREAESVCACMCVYVWTSRKEQLDQMELEQVDEITVLLPAPKIPITKIAHNQLAEPLCTK